MHTIQIQLDDKIYDNILKLNIDIKKEFNNFLERVLYLKEKKIADEINLSLKEIKEGKTKSLNELLDEIWNKWIIC